jgi:hypothetical protein
MFSQNVNVERYKTLYELLYFEIQPATVRPRWHISLSGTKRNFFKINEIIIIFGFRENGKELLDSISCWKILE